jgi:hypothetical protein
MMIGNDQQAIGMPERRQVTEDTNPKKQAQQQADQGRHRALNWQSLWSRRADAGIGSTTQTKSMTWSAILNHLHRCHGDPHPNKFVKFLAPYEDKLIQHID